MHPIQRSLYLSIHANLRIDQDLKAISDGQYFSQGLLKVYSEMLKSLIDIKRDKVFTGKRQKKKALILEVNDIL
jgi:hypothetical protein